MVRHFRWALAAGLFAAVGGWGASASAQVYSPFTLGGTLGWPYGFYQDEHVPYFALHPPVYYSQPVPRTYGWSPFAYPPGVMTPDMAPEPMVIDNPHVEGTSQRGVTRPKPENDRQARVRPRLIENPYVMSDVQIAAE